MGGQRLIVNALVFVTSLSLQLLNMDTRAMEWMSVGPFGGDQFKIEIAPGDPSTLFSIAHFGVHRSQDAGASWEPVHTSEMSNGSMLGLAFDALDPQRVYVSNTLSGVWESPDLGNTWFECAEGLPIDELRGHYYPVISLTVDASGSLYAGLGESTTTPPPAWVYRSLGGCGNWVAHDTGIIVERVTAKQSIGALVSTDATDRTWAMLYSGGVYLHQFGQWTDASGNLPASALASTFLEHDPTDPDHLLLGTERDWIHESHDGGQSWTPIPLAADLVNLPVLPIVYDIAVDPNNSNVSHVLTKDASGSQEIPLFKPLPEQDAGAAGYVTVDGGATWTARPYRGFRTTINPTQVVPEETPGSAGTSRSKTWYMTGGGLAGVKKSEDGAIIFEHSMHGLSNVLVNAVWVKSDAAGERVFAAAESGLYLLDLASGRWLHHRSVHGTAYTWSFARDPLNTGALYYSTGNPAWVFPEQRGVYRTTTDCFGADCGPGEQLLADVGVWRLITTDATPDTIFAATQEQGVMVSTDRGLTWGSLNAGFTLPMSVTDVQVDASGNLRYAAVRGSSGDVTADPPQHWAPNINESGAVYRFDSETTSWVELPGIDFAVLDLELDPVNPGILYAATVQGVLRSTDQGQTWESLLAGVLAQDLAFSPIKPDHIYAATNRGVMRSTDGGAQWHDLSDGLSINTLNAIDVVPSTGVVYLGTGGNSVFELVPDPFPVPDISIAPASLDLGVVPVGFVTRADVRIINLGEDDLVLTEAAVVNGPFEISGATFPVVVTPRNELMLTVTFSPVASSVITGDLVVTSNDPDTPAAVVRLLGEGRPAVGPKLELLINGSDAPPDVSFRDPLKISGAILDPGDFADIAADYWLRARIGSGRVYWFVRNTGWIESLQPLRTLMAPISVTQNPVELNLTAPSSGPVEVTLYVDDNADGAFDGTWSDAVTVNVLPRHAESYASPNSLDFWGVPVSFSTKRNLAVFNQGEADLVITAVLTDHPDFRVYKQ